MQCPRCHAENCDGLRFCEDCGSRLTLTCSQCGGELAPGKRFCGSCGAPAGGESAARTPSPESYRRRALMLTPFGGYDDDGGLNEEGRTAGRRCVD
jgi:hypothetical protein